MDITLATNFASATSLDDLKQQVSDAFRIVENTLRTAKSVSVRRSAKDAYPNGSGVQTGDVVIDLTTTPYTLLTWNTKKWSVVGGTTSTGSGGGGGTGGPTDAQIAAAVATYLTAHPPAKGDKGDTGTAGTVQVAELIVADGVDNPPEIVYNDIDGGDWIYSDPLPAGM